MAGEHLQAQARRVVSGVDTDGRSVIVTDEKATPRTATDAFTICDIWQVGDLPTPVLADSATTGRVELEPGRGGFVHRVTTFPPDSEWNPAAGYRDALAATGGADADRGEGDSGIAGLHQTDTVDIVTVLSGEIWAVMEKDETLLRPGDSFVQRGTQHAWSNRSTEPCTIVAVQMSARR